MEAPIQEAKQRQQEEDRAQMAREEGEVRRGEEIPREKEEESREMQTSVQEESGRRINSFQERPWRAEVRGRRSQTKARQEQQEEMSPWPMGKRRWEIQTEREEKEEKHRYSSAQMLPQKVLHAGGEYLGVVANIITQADEAGFELLGTQRAGVILGPPCQAASHAMPGRWRP